VLVNFHVGVVFIVIKRRKSISAHACCLSKYVSDDRRPNSERRPATHFSEKKRTSQWRWNIALVKRAKRSLRSVSFYSIIVCYAEFYTAQYLPGSILSGVLLSTPRTIFRCLEFRLLKFITSAMGVSCSPKVCTWGEKHQSLAAAQMYQ